MGGLGESLGKREKFGKEGKEGKVGKEGEPCTALCAVIYTEPPNVVCVLCFCLTDKKHVPLAIRTDDASPHKFGLGYRSQIYLVNFALR